MIDLDLASTELDGPGFLRVVAADLVNLAIWLLTNIMHFEPIFHLEVAIALLDDSSEPTFRTIDGNDGGEDEDDETTVIRTSAAQTINDAILVMKAIGEGQPILHLKEAFATLPGAFLPLGDPRIFTTYWWTILFHLRKRSSPLPSTVGR